MKTGPARRPIKGTNAAAVAPAGTGTQPTYVIVNTIGKYGFLYETTSSIGGDVSGQASSFITGSIIENAAGGPIKLDINPIAWYKSDTAQGAAAVGDVTFVYVRVR